MSENALPYPINDADNHFNEPDDCFEKYVDPDKRDLAIRWVTAPSGERVQLWAGRPGKFHSKQVTFSDEELTKLIGENPKDALAAGRPGQADTGSGDDLRVVPGMLLNRLNPLKGLDDAEKKAFIAEFRHKSEAFGNRDLRLALMDEQGIDKALMFPAAAHDLEHELADNVPAIYANVRAFNRWMKEEVGYVVENRMWLPPYISFADPDLALKELEQVMADGATCFQTKSGHAHGGAANPFGGRSLADPVYDRFWSIVNESGMRFTVHLGGTDYQKYSADMSEDGDAVFGDFTNYQWVMCWGDRPAMELTAGLILQNFFGRFPNIKVCLAEQGTVWVPYLLRKMDHSYMMGRKSKFSENGRLTGRPSQLFRQHFLVAPFPEENVPRIAAEIGIEPLVFGSDFPHGEGLARPAEYAAAQLSSFSEADVRKIMRDNFESYFVASL